MERKQRIGLRAMSKTSFSRYLARLIPEYAAEGGRATGMGPEDALRLAQEQIDKLLPEGRHTKGQYLRDIVEGGRSLGVLWYALQPDRSPPRLFLYDIHVDGEHRGSGVGRAALLRLEDDARALGAGEIGLHVFRHNAGAIRLYESLGYRTVNETDGGLQMVKEIAGSPALQDGEPRRRSE